MATDTKLGYWAKRWEEGRTRWHLSEPNPSLVRHIDKLLNGRTGIKVFIPMFGKAVDAKWLYDQGHDIIGVEFVESAVKEYFEEQNIPFSVEPLESISGKLYRTEDGRLKIYCCDFYDITSEIVGVVDAVWDRGGLVAVDRSNRLLYAKILKTLFAPGFRFLLQTVEYRDWFRSGPPVSIPEAAVRFLWEDTCKVELIEEECPEELALAFGNKDEEIKSQLWLISEK